ncbi:MAG: hypothetical protein Q4E29_10445 [Lachnospiraceae bacterium]|nr:hypothetical protein [Lachnospiraceae bacterium]
MWSGCVDGCVSPDVSGCVSEPRQNRTRPAPVLCLNDLFPNA